MKPLVLALSAAILALAVAACGGLGAQSAGPAPSVPAETQAPAASPGDPEQPASPEPHCADPPTFELWFVRDAGTVTGEDGTEVALGPRLFRVTRTGEELEAVAVAEGYRPDRIQYALCPHHNGIEWLLFDALRAGPYRDEAAAGVTSAIPADAKALGEVCCGGGQPSTHDLPAEFESGGSSLELRLRLAQFVFTMTQGQLRTPEGFRYLHEAIRFLIDGQPADVLSADGTVLDRPVTREDFEDLLPPITVEVPALGAEISNPVLIAGTADASVAEVKARVLDAQGNVLAEATATPTTGSRGDFSLDIPFEIAQPQPGSIQVEGRDAAGGSIGLVEIPVPFLP